jgi:peptidoglycan/xylan/chitin deacetylase (PgdA/CDA1 family)
MLNFLLARGLARVDARWRAALVLCLSTCLAGALCARLLRHANADDTILTGGPRPVPVRIAITIDDLPRTRSLPDGHTSAYIVSELVKALRAHKLRSAVGFIVGERVATDSEARAALEIWTQAGYELGNHTYQHRALGEFGADEFLTDLDRMEPLLQENARRSGQATRYFRYPYLEEARSAEERRLLSRALQERGYKLARVSVDFYDWAWAEPFARCLRRGDARALALLSRSYVDYGGAQLAWSVAAAQKLFRRPFTHVLLLHANIATAQNLDALLSEYERQGAQFVSLAEALSDPLYSAEYDGAMGNVLTLANLAPKKPLPPWLGSPLDLLELACPE